MKSHVGLTLMPDDFSITPMDELTDEFIQYIIDIANGERTNNERYNVHGFTMWKSGVTN